MFKLSAMVKKQKDYIQKMRDHANNFINSLDKKEIETILLSGSVSRGDYCPGEKGGMIDLIVMKKEGSKIIAEEIFGQDEAPFIPYHCVRWNGEWFAILFTDFIDRNAFEKLNEPRKFSVMESKILYDPNEKYKNELEKIKEYVEKDLRNKLKETLGYLKYIIGKERRWEIREAYPHMHNNLNIAIELGICCLYYFNGKYAPADDRKLYYTYELEKLPKNYDELLIKLFEQKIGSKEDYERRKELFMEEFIGII
ncbi:MAG: hypothetical protein LBD79_00590 [Treponema sp.]|jgi:hypothetical protein|nr:hypothetical protein [Treponema sp.]